MYIIYIYTPCVYKYIYIHHIYISYIYTYPIMYVMKYPQQDYSLMTFFSGLNHSHFVLNSSKFHHIALRSFSHLIPIFPELDPQFSSFFIENPGALWLVPHELHGELRRKDRLDHLLRRARRGDAEAEPQVLRQLGTLRREGDVESICGTDPRALGVDGFLICKNQLRY